MAKKISKKKIFFDLSKIRESHLELSRPHTEDYNIWADFIELYTLSSPDKTTSVNDIADLIKDSNVGKEDGKIDEDENTSTDDKYKKHAQSYFNYIEKRIHLFAKNYPFQLKGKTLKVKNKISIEQNLYVYLLLSSNLKFVQKFQFDITHQFELLSLLVFKKYFPEDSHVHYFGTGAKIKNTFSNKNLFQRLSHLAEIARIEALGALNQTNFPLNNNGDYGIDLVGWKKYHENDKADRTLIMFAQCGCGAKWEEKMLSCSQAKLSSIYSFKFDTPSFLFIPHLFRNVHGDWVNSAKINSAILVDRLRIFNDLTKKEINSIVTEYKKLIPVKL